MSKNINEVVLEKIFSFSKFMRQNMLHEQASQLTFLQMEALIAINTAKIMPMRQIAQQFHIAMPTATALIDRLKELKLIARKNDTKDRRIVYVFLTKKGQKLLEKGQEKRKAHIKNILTSITVSEKEMMITILEKMIIKAQETYEKK